MIEKKEENKDTPDAALLAQTCQYLETSTLEAQTNVRSTFSCLYEALQSREKQLLRQIDVAHSQQMALVQSSIDNSMLDRIPHVTVQMDGENAVKESILSLGSVGLEGAGLVVLNGDGTFLQRVEDYQDATQDHMSMFKPLPLDESISPGEEAVIRFNRLSLSQVHRSCSNESNGVKSVDDSQEALELEKTAGVENQEHPAQVQQWLKQISAETETEPSVGEPKNFVPLTSPVKAT